MGVIIRGEVIHGKQVGRKIGYPTANLRIDPQMDVADGVYAGEVIVDGERFGALINLGYNPTVGGKYRTLEAHLLNFDRSLYRKTITVELIEYIRPEQYFSSMEALRQQIELDQQAILKIIQNAH